MISLAGILAWIPAKTRITSLPRFTGRKLETWITSFSPSWRKALRRQG